MNRLTKWIIARSNAFAGQVAADPVVRSLAIETFIRSELDRVRAKHPDDLVLEGFKVFSQVDEDGIIEAISTRLPTSARNKTFIEIGCGRGIENNTAYLVLKGYRGVWVDGSPDNIAYIRQNCPGIDTSRVLKVDEQFILRTNIADLLRAYVAFLGTAEIECFSLDIDGNDAYVLKEALTVIRPAMVVVEYNGKFPPSLNVSIAYNASHHWQRDDYFGASLAKFQETLAGYSLVTCNISGANAFFVRDDLVGGMKIHPAEEVYRWRLPELAERGSWNSSSLSWVRTKLEESAQTV